MSSADKIREWESHLPSDLKKRIDDLVDQITKQMDAINKREEVIDELIKIFISLCDEMGLPRDQTSVYIKHRLKGIVSDDMIEKRLPRDRKRTHKDYETYRQLVNRRADHQEPVTEQEIELSSSGMQEPFEPEPEPLPTREEVLETTSEIAIVAMEEKERERKELEVRLKEALDLADKKQDEIENLQLRIGEFEFQLKDALSKVMNANKKAEDKEVDSIIAEYQNENKQLKEALQRYVKKEEFKSAAKVDEPSTVWIAAINLIGFIKSLTQTVMKLDDNAMKGKVLFDIAIDGSIKNPRLDTATPLQEN